MSIARATDHRTKAPPRKQTASCNCAAKPAFARSCCAATPIFPKPVISMIGIATREFAFTSATTLRKTWRKSQTICRNRRGDPCSVPRYSVKTQPRRRRANVKEQVVKEREFENKRLVSEDVAEFDYRPTACRKTYRMAVVRKNISVEKGEQVLFPEERYFFYITNERKCKTAEVVYEANDRCNQENHIAQLKGAVRALHAPVDNLESNWAYMLMTALAWNLKAWWALMLPEDPGRWQEKHHAEKQWVLKLEFKTFLNAFMLLPCQIIKTGRKLVYRLLGWNPHLPIFFRLLDALRC